MSRTSRLRFLGLVGAGVIGLFSALTACADGAEGDRCQTENGSDDCQAGLICLSSGRNLAGGATVDSGDDGGDGGSAGGASRPNFGQGNVNPPYNNSDRCCPFDRSTATHPACTLNNPSVNPESGTPADTGPPVEAGADAADASDAADAADAADASDAADAADAD